MTKKIVIYSIITIGLLFALHAFVLQGLRKNEKGIYDKYTTIFYKQNNYRTVMIGSSRMFMHLDNVLFDSITGSHSYNLGLPGATIRLAYACLKSYCVHSTLPKQVFLELDYHISHLKTDAIYNFATYFPYLDNPELYKQLCEIDRRFVQFKYNPCYGLPYLGINSLQASLNGWFHKAGYYDTYFTNGFFKNEQAEDPNTVDAVNWHSAISDETKAYLDSTIAFCDTKGIQLFFTISPAYKTVFNHNKQHQPVIQLFKKIAKQHHIHVFDVSSDTTICHHKNYFEDNYHMLYPGAMLYTRKIASEYNNIKKPPAL